MNLLGGGVMLAYFVINILYSIAEYKSRPIMDIIILAAGYYLRVLLGSVISGIEISMWLYLVIIAGSFYMGFGKRRNELINNGDSTRTVLQYYNKEFLDSSMNCCMTLTIVFFSLWCMEKGNIENMNYLFLVPIIMIIFFRYNYNLQDKNNDGDPVNIILKDPIFLILIIIIVVCLFMLVY